jgi:hypothetical protein
VPIPNGPQIQPQPLPFGGESLEFIADADPRQYPSGLEVVVFEPGKLEALGRVVLMPGCMLAGVPPGMSGQIRNALRRHMAQQHAPKPPGSSPPPGLVSG